MNSNSVSVIIPTTAELKRSSQIKRCINSIRHSSAQPVTIIVVVNGDRYDDKVCAWLQEQEDIGFEYISKGSSPNAVAFGRSKVSSPFFSTIDDDDEYLAGATDIKLSALQSTPDADLVVTNGFRHIGGHDAMLYRHFKEVTEQPFKALFQQNWLHNCNALYRTETIQNNFFENYHSYAEWTWLAFQLMLVGKKVIAIDTPAFRYYDTPDSLSKSSAYSAAYLPLFQRMLDAEPPVEIKRLIQVKMSAAYHDDASRKLHQGTRKEALKDHILSLKCPGGMRYLLFSRKFIPGWPI